MEHLVFSLSFWVSDCLVSDGLVLAAAFATSGPVGGNLFVWCTSCSGLGDSVPARLPAFCIVSLVMTRWWSLCHKQLQHSACDTRLLRSARRHERVTRRVGHRPLNPTGTPRRPLFFFLQPAEQYHVTDERQPSNSGRSASAPLPPSHPDLCVIDYFFFRLLHAQCRHLIVESLEFVDDGRRVMLNVRSSVGADGSG